MYMALWTTVGHVLDDIYCHYSRCTCAHPAPEIEISPRADHPHFVL